MTDYGVLANLLVIFTVSIAVVFVFHKFRLPSIAGFLVAGALIGPHGLNLISDIGTVQVLAEIGVVLLLFTIGIEFSLAQLASMRRLMFLAAPLQVGGVLLIAWLGATLVGLSWRQGLFWGFLFSLSSTAIVLKTLAERGDNDSIHGRATIGILVFQDLAVVPMMLLTPILASQSDGGGLAILLTLGKSILVIVLVIAAAWYLVPKLLEHIVRSRSRELFLLTIIVLCLGIAWLTSLGGLSLALGAFIAGLVISESEYSHQAMAEVLPFRDSFNSLFFVSVGILMDWRVLFEHPLPVAGLLVTVLLVKFAAGAGAVLLAEVPPVQSIPHDNDVVLHPDLFALGMQDVGGGAAGQPMTKPLPGLRAAGQARRPLHEKGGGDHRKHRDRKKNLIGVALQEAAFLPLLRQEKAELADLGQGDTHHDRRAGRNLR